VGDRLHGVLMGLLYSAKKPGCQKTIPLERMEARRVRREKKVGGEKWVDCERKVVGS
jgi:hypothetical protein